MSAERWYLVAYDIADNKRLARLHRLMKKEGLAAQRSIFFVRATPAAVSPSTTASSPKHDSCHGRASDSKWLMFEQD